MAGFKQITSIEGERWDNVAQRAYGDSSKMNDIRDANPDVLSYERLPGGIVLQVPIIEEDTAPVNAAKLPPWKQ